MTPASEETKLKITGYKRHRIMGKYNFRINGHDYDVEVNSVENGVADVTVNGTDYKVELGDSTPAAASSETVQQHGSRHAMPAPMPSRTVIAGNPGPAAAAPQAQAASAQPSGKGETVTSPLPGVILDIRVKVGDSVKAGQTVAVLEAMKMENEIEASVSGTVTAVSAAKGDSVLEGAAIVTIG